MSTWFDKGLSDSQYDLNDDEEELEKTYVCECCGCTFTLGEALSDFADRFNYDLSYNGCGYDGSLCGNCAADEEEAKFNE